MRSVIQVGDRVGPFTIVARLGRGGMSTVYNAYEAGLDREVALKVLPIDLLEEPGFADRFEIGVTHEQLGRLTSVSRTFDELLNRAPARQAPYVGASAFATKAGIHASALLKDFSTYEHVPPESVGNERAIMVSQQAGKSNLLTALARHGITLEKDDPRLEKLLKTVKDREASGYSYDGADASFAVLARHAGRARCAASIARTVSARPMSATSASRRGRRR